MELSYIWNENIRIDVFLTKNFSYSRNFFHHIIERDGILINWKKIKKSQKIKFKDHILIDDLQRFINWDIMEESPNINLKIMYEWNDYMVILKPKWVLSHPWSIFDISSPSVSWFLYHKFKILPSIWNFIRCWVVHRLDKETDGPMIIVKNEKWLSYFKNLFQQKSALLNDKKYLEQDFIKLKKIYKAKTIPTKNWIEFIEKIKQNLPFYIEQLVVPKVWFQQTPKIWISKIIEIKKIESIYEIFLEIITWRTHQIRYHLSQNWLPIIWDFLYWWEKSDKLNLSCIKLEFEDSNWEYKSFENM